MSMTWHGRLDGHRWYPAQGNNNNNNSNSIIMAEEDDGKHARSVWRLTGEPTEKADWMASPCLFTRAYKTLVVGRYKGARRVGPMSHRCAIEDYLHEGRQGVANNPMRRRDGIWSLSNSRDRPLPRWRFPSVSHLIHPIPSNPPLTLSPSSLPSFGVPQLCPVAHRACHLSLGTPSSLFASSHSCACPSFCFPRNLVSDQTRVQAGIESQLMQSIGRRLPFPCLVLNRLPIWPTIHSIRRYLASTFEDCLGP
ncbi:hypothetical protein LX36DRAFT_655303 [Colletotrichum falcatum]|nr:hypothetical protein LX36DRAFT_655303 [Colletotrichum falcatum]